MKKRYWKPLIIFGLIAMFAIMSSAMIFIVVMFSGSGISMASFLGEGLGQVMWGLMIFFVVIMIAMLLVMFFFFRKMKGRNKLMSNMMGYDQDQQL